MGFVGDITNPGNAEKWVDETVKKFGGIDVLVNNAGSARPGALAELPESAWQTQFDLNLFAPVRLARLCAAHMEKRGGGSIINIGSIYGRESGGPLTYNASKAALHSFTKMLAREFAPKNIRVNTIAPGSILTPGGIWEQLFRENPAFEKDFISHEMPAGTPRPSRRSRVRGRDARVAARELDHGREHPGGRRAGTFDPLMFFQCTLLTVAAVTVIGCSSPLPSTELPPARYIQSAPEFPGLSRLPRNRRPADKSVGDGSIGNRGPRQGNRKSILFFLPIAFSRVTPTSESRDSPATFSSLREEHSMLAAAR